MKLLSVALLISAILFSGSSSHAEQLDQLHFDLNGKGLVQFAVENCVIALMGNESYNQNFESGKHLSCIMMILDMLVFQDIETEANFEYDLVNSGLSPEEINYAQLRHDLEAEHMLKYAGYKWRFWRNILGVEILTEDGYLSTTNTECERLAEEMRVAFLPLLQPLPPGESIMDSGPKDRSQ